jgi:hypothetical protein
MIAVAIVAVVIVILTILAVVLSPAMSPLASIRDTDGDGHADSDDAFPDNEAEWADADLDGVGDNSDEFPSDSTQWTDGDNDGFGDNPLGMNPDIFPNDPSEWRDTDSDGTGDNADFYDNGNGKVRISVTSFVEDGTADFWTYSDTFFIIEVDRTADGVFEDSFTSGIFTDTQSLTSPYAVVVDVPENSELLKFSIQVFDDDIGSEQVLDYCPAPSGTYYIHAVPSPFSGSWSYDGSVDGLSEIDCALSYSLSVTN